MYEWIKMLENLIQDSWLDILFQLKILDIFSKQGKLRNHRCVFWEQNHVKLYMNLMNLWPRVDFKSIFRSPQKMMGIQSLYSNRLQ